MNVKNYTKSKIAISHPIDKLKYKACQLDVFFVYIPNIFSYFPLKQTVMQFGCSTLAFLFTFQKKILSFKQCFLN